MTPKAAGVARNVLLTLTPPEDMLLADWTEKNIRIPQGQSARPGPTKMWPYLVEPLNAIGDRALERVTVQKSARVGMTKCMVFAVAARAATDPCPIIFLCPRYDDTRGMAVDEIEPIFRESPALKGLLRLGRGDGRNTLMRKSLAGGGSIKILSAMAPSNLRRHDCALLCADEVDGYKVTAEGDALALAERRTMAQPHPKIVCCSTPVDEDTSVITQRYSEGSQEIFEVPCPRCGTFNEIQWSHLEWENHDPETVKYLCPNCRELIPERHKPAMVEAGRWRALKPEIKAHRSFKINALVSLLPMATWPKLVTMYLEAKRGGPSTAKVFRNTILGLPWRTTINRVDASILADRAESWGLETPHHGAIIPENIVVITCGVDTQDDRVECVLIGFPVYGAPCILGHVVFAGNTLDDGVWKTLDSFLKTRWRHPNGWMIGVDGTAIDSGGREGRTQKVYDFCYPRMSRYIFAIKGFPGPRKIWTKLTSVKGDMRAFGVAVDVIKTEVLDRLAHDPFNEDGSENPQAFRLSDQLSDEFFEQVTNETRRVRFSQNRPVIEFMPKRAGAPTEGLDCTVYALAVRQSPSVRAIDMRERAARRPQPGEPTIRTTAGSWAEKFAQL